MRKSIIIIGGHTSPAVAVIEEMLPSSRWDIHFIGRYYAFEEAKSNPSFEYETIRKMGVPFYKLHAPRFPRRSIISIITYPFKLIASYVQSMQYIMRIRPAVVIGFGGYISVPVILAAYTMRIPTIIHEQTIHASRANILLSRIATIIATSWEETQKEYPKAVYPKIRYVGDPVRPQLTKSAGGEMQFDDRINNIMSLKKPLLVYITGGSTGAHAINIIILEALSKLTASYRIIHQCGDSQYHDYSALIKERNALSPYCQDRYLVRKYFTEQEVSRIMQSADIMVSRAGINTTIEIALYGIPALVIPLPLVPGGEQYDNAALLESYGSSVTLRQDSLTAETLLTCLAMIARQRSMYHERAAKIHTRKEIAIHKKAAYHISMLAYHLSAHRTTHR